MFLGYFGVLHQVQIYFDSAGFIVINATCTRNSQGRGSLPS